MKQHAVSSRIILTSLRCVAAWRATSLATGERRSPSSDHHFGSRDQIRDRLGVLSWRPLFSRGGSLRHGSSSTPEAGFRVAAAGSSRGLASSVSPPFGLRGSSSLVIRVAVGAGCPRRPRRPPPWLLVQLLQQKLQPRTTLWLLLPVPPTPLRVPRSRCCLCHGLPLRLTATTLTMMMRLPNGVSGVVPAAPDAAIKQPWVKVGAAIARGMSRHPRRHARRRLLAPSPSSEEPTASVSVAWRRSISSLTVMALLDAWHAAFRTMLNVVAPRVSQWGKFLASVHARLRISCVVRGTCRTAKLLVTTAARLMDLRI